MKINIYIFMHMKIMPIFHVFSHPLDRYPKKSSHGYREVACWEELIVGHIGVYQFTVYIYTYTLPKTNIAPENGWLEDYFPFGMSYFQVRTVSFREGNTWTRLRPWLRPWAILTWHFVEDARNAARVLNSMYGLLVHMLISSHFFHGFVSSKKNTQWNLCVLKASAEKKTCFFYLVALFAFWANLPSASSNFGRTFILNKNDHVCNDKTSTVA